MKFLGKYIFYIVIFNCKVSCMRKKVIKCFCLKYLYYKGIDIFDRFGFFLKKKVFWVNDWKKFSFMYSFYMKRGIR